MLKLRVSQKRIVNISIVNVPTQAELSYTETEQPNYDGGWPKAGVNGASHGNGSVQFHQTKEFSKNGSISTWWPSRVDRGSQNASRIGWSKLMHGKLAIQLVQLQDCITMKVLTGKGG
jgi:hypothetical protein